MKAVWRLQASSDLQAIADYYLALGLPGISARIIEAIQYSVVLRTQPGFNRAANYIREDDTYEIVVPGLPYVVSYRPSDDVLDIIGVAHTARELSERRRS